MVTHFELCLSYLADTSNEAAALRRENDELRIANEDLAKLVDEFSKLSLTKEHPIPLRPLTSLPANEEHLRPSQRTPLKIKNVVLLLLRLLYQNQRLYLHYNNPHMA